MFAREAIIYFPFLLRAPMSQASCLPQGRVSELNRIWDSNTTAADIPVLSSNIYIRGR